MIVKPFEPWIYSGKIEQFVSPPFDTIEKDDEIELREYDDNIIHITLPESYDQARDFLFKLISNGKIQKLNSSIIVINITYYNNNSLKTLSGIIALIDVDDNNIITHERTFKKFVDDRINLMQNIDGQPEPIFIVVDQDIDFAIYDILNSGNPKELFNFKFKDTSFEVSLISDPENIGKIVSKFEGIKGIVADGHHRFEASRMIYKRTGSIFWKYVMAFIVPLRSDGLKTSGVHRLIKSDLEFSSLKICLEQYFEFSKVENHLDNRIEIFKDGLYEMIPKSDENGLIEGLPVSQINKYVFEKCLKWSASEISNRVYFTNRIDEVVRGVKSGEYSFGILMPSFNKDKFELIATSRIPLPQKSTYFSPKIVSGIALNLNL